MIRLTRISFVAALLLLAFFSLPLWLPGLQSGDERSAEKQNAAVNRGVVMPTPTQAPSSKPSNPSFSDPELPAMTLVDAGWVTRGSTMQRVLHPPAILRWDPARAAVDWRLETGSILGAYMDEEGRVYVMEEHRLTTLNGRSGEVLSRKQLKDMPASGPNEGQPVPIGRQGPHLYLRNYAMRNNLFVYDMRTGVFGKERWSVCESGHPFDSVYLPEEKAFVTFCIDFWSGMQGVLARLSIENGASASVEIPALGADEYMTGNGFALGPDHLAYVVDSDAGALVEIDLDAMQILRQANYRQGSKERGWLQSAVSHLVELAFSPAQAKRWMSQPAVSPDGRYLVVDGGFGLGGGETTSAWLIDLESLTPVNEIELPRSPQAFHFASDNLLYILLQTELPGASQALVFDLDRQQSLTLDLPTSGRVLQFLP